MSSIVTKILNLCKTYKHGLFIGLCMVLTVGIGYNIGRISALHTSPIDDSQTANLYDGQHGATSPDKALPTVKITKPAIPTDPRVVASKAAGSKLYHYSWCSGAQRIKETNKLWFPTEADAISAGYTLAANCPDSY